MTRDRGSGAGRGARDRPGLAVVTGAAGAIGAATARVLARDGYRLALLDRNGSGLASTADECRALGAEVDFHALDLTDAEAVRGAFHSIANVAQINAIAAIAGVAGKPAPIHELDPRDWDDTLTINLRSLFLTVRFGAEKLVAAGGGAIVTMASSMAKDDVLGGASAYAASKGAALALTRTAAFDLAPHGVRVNAVCPGVIRSRLALPDLDEDAEAAAVERFASRIPLRRIGEPDDVAEVIAFLLSARAAHITGVGWLIDGGQTMQSWANSP